MRAFKGRDWQLLLAGIAVPLFLVGFVKWREAVIENTQQPAEPFRIAGNFYYVGGPAVSAFLITGPQGHVVLDSATANRASLIIASIEKLGFSIKDVKVLLNSNADGDYAGALAALQQASGAELWASDASAGVLESGGDDPDMALRARVLVGIGILSYPPPRVDRRFKDGDTIHVGPLALTAHVTAGATRGCTSWSFVIRDGDRDLNVVSACPLRETTGLRHAQHAPDLERSFRVLRSLPADIWVTSQSRAWGRYRKFAARDSAKNPVDPFIDPDGYRAFIDDAESEFPQTAVH